MLRNGNLRIIWSDVVLKLPGLESDREPSRTPGEEGINFSIWCGSPFRHEAQQLRLRVLRRIRRLGGAPALEHLILWLAAFAHGFPTRSSMGRNHIPLELLWEAQNRAGP